MSSDPVVETSKTEATHADTDSVSEDQESGSSGADENTDTKNVSDEEISPETKGKSELAMPRRLVFVAAALATAALLAAAVFGILSQIAASADNAGLSSERDDVLRVGTAVFRAVTELDYTKPDQSFDRSIAVSTSDFGRQITADRETRKQVLVQSKTTTTTTVLDAAVDELNVDQGKASVLGALRIEIKQGDRTVPKLVRIEINLTRLDQNGERVWKLSGIDPVPVIG